MKKYLLGVLILVVFPGIAFAVQNSTQINNDKIYGQVADLTNKLSFYAKGAVSKNIKSQSGDINSVRNLAIKRKQLMDSLAKSNPRLFLNLVLPKSLKDALPNDIQKNIETESTLTGQIEVIHIDDFNHQENSHFQYFVHSNGKKTPLYLSKDLISKSGATVKVSGFAAADGVVADTDNLSVIIKAAQPESLGDQKTLIILATFPDSGVAPFTRDEASNSIFKGQFQKFYKEQSYNKVSFSGDVYGWITVNKPGLSGQACGQVTLDDPEVKSYIINNNINLANYGRLVFVLNKEDLGGGCSGVGKSSVLFNGNTYSLSQATVSSNNGQGSQPFPFTYFDYVLSHEMGHSLGVAHANGWDCGGAVLHGSDCQHLEYGNNFDTMGSGAGGLHFNAFYKELLGWISPNDTVTIKNSGTYFINPLEIASSSKKIAKIQIYNSTSTPFYLEYRQGVGFDSKLNSDPNLFSNKLGLFVNYIIYNNDPFSRLLDMSPTNLDWYNDSNSGTLNVGGGSFFDQGTGVTLGPVLSASSTGIIFNVNLSKPQCVRDLPVIGMLEGSRTVVQGGGGYLGIRFENTDSPACGLASIFDFMPIWPNGSGVWKYDIFPLDGGNLPVSPGAQAYKGINYTVPPNLVPGSYKLFFNLTNRTSGLVRQIPYDIVVQPAPAILNLIPPTGKPGTEVNINGTNLTGENLSLIFSNLDGFAQPIVSSIGSNTLKFTVPANITPPCYNQPCPYDIPTPSGIYQVVVNVNNVSTSTNFEVSTTPYTISSISQSGDIVSILGKDFETKMTVSVNGKVFSANAQPTVLTDTTDVVSFSQKAQAISNGQQSVFVSGLKGNSNNYNFNFGSSTTPRAQALVTSVSATLTTQYNQQNPSRPLLVSTHKIKIKAINGPVYIPQYNNSKLFGPSGKNIPGSISNTITSSAPVYVSSLKAVGEKAWLVNSGQEYEFILSSVWSSGLMFAGNYYSSLAGINYWTDPNNTTTNIAPINQQTPTIAIIGEQSPYINSITPTYPTPVPAGQKIYILGERLAGATASLISSLDGSKIGLQVASSSPGYLSAQIPLSALTGQYSAELSNSQYGQSNRLPVSIESAPFISNVSVKGDNTTWTQGTVKDVAWQTGGGIANVDVLVCSDSPTTCFYAYKNAVNNGYSSNVKVGFNMPASTASTTKSGYIKIQQTNNPSLFSISPKFRVVAPSPVTPVGTTTPPIGTTTSQTASVILSIQALIDSMQAMLNAQ